METESRISLYDVNFHEAIFAAEVAVGEAFQKPKIECPLPVSNASSQVLLNKTSKNFCKNVMKNLKTNIIFVVYDINGNEMPRLKTFMSKKK